MTNRTTQNLATSILDADREWAAGDPASEEQIESLRKATRSDLPAAYLDLLRISNGGEGPLALAPLWLQLYDAALVAELANQDFYRDEFEGLFFFASNGGLESIAFDTRGVAPWPIVMVDCIAGMESAEKIADSVSEFIEAIGLESQV